MGGFGTENVIRESFLLVNMIPHLIPIVLISIFEVDPLCEVPGLELIRGSCCLVVVNPWGGLSFYIGVSSYISGSFQGFRRPVSDIGWSGCVDPSFDPGERV